MCLFGLRFKVLRLHLYICRYVLFDEIEFPYSQLVPTESPTGSHTVTSVFQPLFPAPNHQNVLVNSKSSVPMS